MVHQKKTRFFSSFLLTTTRKRKRSENESDAERRKKLPVDCFSFFVMYRRGVALKVKRKHLLYVKLFCPVFYLRITYSVFLRHSLDFDGVMW